MLPALDPLLGILLLCSDCTGGAPPLEDMLRVLPADDLDGVVSEQVVLDLDTTNDGGGALRIDAEGPERIVLYEVDGLELEPGRGGYLAFRASLKSRDLDGFAYIEAACPVEGQEEMLAKGSPSRVGATTPWTRHQAPLFPPKDPLPDRVELRLVVHGAGTVWVDELEVLWVEPPGH